MIWTSLKKKTNHEQLNPFFLGIDIPRAALIFPERLHFPQSLRIHLSSTFPSWHTYYSASILANFQRETNGLWKYAVIFLSGRSFIHCGKPKGRLAHHYRATTRTHPSTSDYVVFLLSLVKKVALLSLSCRKGGNFFDEGESFI